MTWEQWMVARQFLAEERFAPLRQQHDEEERRHQRALKTLERESRRAG